MNRIFTIAQITIKGELRNKVVYILTAIAFLFFFLARGCTPGKVNVENGLLSADQITNIGIIFTFNCIIFWGLSLCGLLAMSTLPREIREETIILTITKPIKRGLFLAGKFLGMFSIIIINLMVLAPGFLFLFYLRTGNVTLNIFPSLAVILLNFILIISLIFLFSLFLPRAVSALLTLILYATSLGLSIPFFFEKVRGYWEPSFTSQVLHYSLPQFGGLHLYALSFMSDFFPSAQGLWSAADITVYIIVIWLVMIFVFKRKAL